MDGGYPLALQNNSPFPLVPLSSPSPVVSLAQVRDPILGSHFLALLHTGHLLFQDQTQFHIQTQVTKSTEDGARLADQLALASSDIDPALLTSILAEQPIDEVLPFIKTSASGGVHISYPIANTGRIVTGQVQPKSSVAGAAAEIMHYPSGVDKDTVEQLHAFTAKLRDSVKTVLCYLVAARARKDCFESEAKRADDLLTYVERTVSHDSETGTVAIQSRVDTCVKNMERLTKRVDVLLQICMETYSPGLSEYEIKWAEELERMKKQVHTFVGQTQKVGASVCQVHTCADIGHHVLPLLAQKPDGLTPSRLRNLHIQQ